MTTHGGNRITLERFTLPVGVADPQRVYG